jgi:hypothetical protein
LNKIATIFDWGPKAINSIPDKAVVVGRCFFVPFFINGTAIDIENF